ncbi:Shikimate dehydrogenase [Planctomycetes bacterium Pan216]|uniref:Multifunctional fusion protein n=1 Tax=Kolteria novifilia TaxID=2527975 RepID=A0A518BBZ0_9BACT|nr:Shikimate dehydrogenase [Planctomycetes bacterium Pan216]
MGDICVSVAEKSREALLEQLRRLPERGAGCLEVRFDYLEEPTDLAEILDQRTCPLIATARRPEDGGRWNRPEAERRKLLRDACRAGFDYVDLEEDIAHHIPREGDAKRLISYHDMLGMPDNLPTLAHQLEAGDADVLKIAVMPQRVADTFRLLRWATSRKVPALVIAMGDLGVASRILNAKVGSPFTFAAADVASVVAPGMLTLAELRDVYHYPSIGADTRVFGVIGDPIAQSLSPKVHNAAFAADGQDTVYVPFRVPEEELDEFMAEATAFGIEGLSVTIPHKQRLLRHGDVRDPLVSAAHSSNTWVHAEGRRALFNTDGPAVLHALEQLRGTTVLENVTALILGAGGVSRTIAVVLGDAGAQVVLANRTRERAEALAKEVGVDAVDWEERGAVACDLLVNATKVGMVPKIDETPFPEASLREGMVVFDTVYNPERTKLIESAAARGCQVVTGAEMFVHQAEAQYRLFTGRAPKRGLMLEVVRQAFATNK